MNIRDILDIRSIVIDLNVKDKDELLDYMSVLAYESGNILDLDEIKERISVREKLMPTGVGNGIALPHAKSDKIKKTVGAFAVLSKPIDYDSLDNEPVNIVLLIVGKESNIGQHLKLLSKISKIISRETFISDILNAETSDEVLDIFERQIE